MSSRPAGERPSRARRLRRVPLRPRLVLIFAVLAATTCAALAVTSYLIVQRARLAEAVDEARRGSFANLRLANNLVLANPGDLGALARALARPEGFDVVGLQGGQSFQTSEAITPASIPAALQAPVARSRVALVRAQVAHAPYLVVGGRAGQGGPDLYFFYPFGGVVHDLRQLRTVLLAISGLLVVASGFLGLAAARPMLLPIREVAEGARRLQEGSLEVELAEEGNDELAALARSFNQMARALGSTVTDLRGLEASHRRFVSDVSHELRTPLTAMCTSAELLSADLPKLDGETRRAASLLIGEVYRLRRLVEDLMEISRLDAGAAGLACEPVDLGEAVRDALAVRGWEGQVGFHRGGDLHTYADPRRLDAIVGNLVNNAFEHGLAPVELDVTADGDDLRLRVSDAGPGIAPEHLGLVFDRFYKADPSRPRSAGSGLGLAIAQENARLHGGDITVEDRPGGGAVFTLSLPRRGEP